MPDDQNFSWQASEYIYHQKNPGWYLMLFAAAAALITFAVWTRQWLTAGLFGVMLAALTVYANKAPRSLNYQLDEGGVTVGTKFYAYDQFRSFGVLQDVGWHAIDLEPTKRLMPRLTILFADGDRDTIIDILENQLPRLDHQPDIIDRLARRLKF